MTKLFFYCLIFVVRIEIFQIFHSIPSLFRWNLWSKHPHNNLIWFGNDIVWELLAQGMVGMQTWPIYLTSNNSCQRYDQKHVFCTYWPCDLDRWAVDLINIPAPELISINICANSEHSNFMCSRAMVLFHKSKSLIVKPYGNNTKL